MSVQPRIRGVDCSGREFSGFISSGYGVPDDTNVIVKSGDSVASERIPRAAGPPRGSTGSNSSAPILHV